MKQRTIIAFYRFSYRGKHDQCFGTFNAQWAYARHWLVFLYNFSGKDFIPVEALFFKLLSGCAFQSMCWFHTPQKLFRKSQYPLQYQQALVPIVLNEWPQKACLFINLDTIAICSAWNLMAMQSVAAHFHCWFESWLISIFNYDFCLLLFQFWKRIYPFKLRSRHIFVNIFD